MSGAGIIVFWDGESQGGDMAEIAYRRAAASGYEQAFSQVTKHFSPFDPRRPGWSWPTCAGHRDGNGSCR
jgi:hypothetical protein